MKKILCPICLSSKYIKKIDSDYICKNILNREVIIKQKKRKTNSGSSNNTDNTDTVNKEYCNTKLMPRYVETTKMHKVIIFIVGYRNHGKTVYNDIMMASIKNIYKNEIWDGYAQFVNQKAEEHYSEIPKWILNGHCPPSTQIKDPVPIVYRMHNVPMFGDIVPMFYDVKGELFEKLEKISPGAKYLAKSPVVLFLVSLKDLIENNNDDELEWQDKLHRLLQIFDLGVCRSTKQELVVILSKGDKLFDIGMDQKVIDYLNEGDIDVYKFDDKTNKKKTSKNVLQYIENMKNISKIIRNWLIENKCKEFINHADSVFKNVEFCIVSSLGSDPIDNKMHREIRPNDPKRILDPFLWMIEKQARKSFF